MSTRGIGWNFTPSLLKRRLSYLSWYEFHASDGHSGRTTAVPLPSGRKFVNADSGPHEDHAIALICAQACGTHMKVREGMFWTPSGLAIIYDSQVEGLRFYKVSGQSFDIQTGKDLNPLARLDDTKLFSVLPSKLFHLSSIANYCFIRHLTLCAIRLMIVTSEGCSGVDQNL